jgi:hypothetical protein
VHAILLNIFQVYLSFVVKLPRKTVVRPLEPKSAGADKLTTNTLDDAAHVMRSGNIAVYDRSSRKIALIRHVGATQDKLEFRD